jgi:hypothetical protein
MIKDVLDPVQKCQDEEVENEWNSYRQESNLSVQDLLRFLIPETEYFSFPVPHCCIVSNITAPFIDHKPHLSSLSASEKDQHLFPRQEIKVSSEKC